jgi:phosphate transport system protein
MGKLVQSRLKDALDAYTNQDLDQAMRVWQKDQEVDEHYKSLFRELLTYMMSDPRMIGACAQLLFVGKNLERIGDHATNVAEMLYYEVTGEEIVGDRPRWNGPDGADFEGPAA